ncbi:MAG TPA: SUMF1/EgtB/PvdO family nonheme iron enzyme [Bryobacteraceae bacterium]|jgi:formylglycine-generating enzyme required for sulfatase activity
MRGIFICLAAIAFSGLMLAAAVDFDKQVAPVIEKNCLACHGARKGNAGIRLHTKEAAFKGGWAGKVIVPGDGAKSPLYMALEIPPDKTGSMPPGQPLPPEQRAAIKQWIDEGAPWPEGKILKQPGAAMDENELVDKLHERIVKGASPSAAMKPYKMTIPQTTVDFEMVAIPFGEYMMGTPESEKGHKKDEGPQHAVKIDPFWMEKYEVTWDEYRLFMFAKLSGETLGGDPLVDAISRPTRPYVEMSFGMGINGYPAISMTQHAANKYAEWLSAKTGQFYRLPTEAEWEYACRAGTTTAYYWGDDASQIGDYAVYAGNSGGKYAKVGTKKPNPWGLYDMSGNVMEWTLDQYLPQAYLHPPKDWERSKDAYPHSVRGGGWADDAAKLRCGARNASDPSWKQQDPQLPKSIWYMTDAQWLGFRLVRPLKVPSAKEMYAYWNNGVEIE